MNRAERRKAKRRESIAPVVLELTMRDLQEHFPGAASGDIVNVAGCARMMVGGKPRIVKNCPPGTETPFRLKVMP